MTGTLWIFAAFFAFVGGMVFAAGYAWMRHQTAEAGVPAPAPARSLREALAAALVSLGQFMPAPRKEPLSLRKQLFQAGYRGPSAVTVFHGVRLVAAGLLALAAAMASVWSHGSVGNAMLPAVAGAGFGYLLPVHVLVWLTKRRKRHLRHAIPPAIDLLVLATEAGQTLDQSMYDTAASLHRVYPDLSQEFLFCHLEMRAGKSRSEALKHLGERSAEPEMNKLASLLIDGERFGTSLGPALRNHARYLRMRMRQQAQEAARKLGVKLVFPVFFLIFPSVLLVTLGPAYLLLRGFVGKLLGD